MKTGVNYRGTVLTAVIFAGFLVLAACGGNNGGGAGMSAAGGVITEEPQWAQGIDIPFGGKDIDTSVPGNYGYYSEDGEFATVYDADGIPFTFKKGSIKRIINLWPSNTSGMLALGAEEFFIARLGVLASPWQEVMFPRYAALKEQVGAAQGSSANNAEALMALKPDLIIGNQSSVEGLRDIEYGGQKLPVINVYFNTYQEMKVTFRVIGKILGGRVEENAETWGNMLQANIDRVAKGLERTGVRPVVYYSSGGIGGMNATMPMMGSGTVVMNEWTGYAGGKYWPGLMRALRNEDAVSQTSVSMELILKYPPQKMFIGGGRQPLDEILADVDGGSNPWAGIIADMGADNVTYVPFVLFGWDRFGAESVLQILWAARHIHPDIFADPASPDYIDIQGETKNFYAGLTGYPITDAQVEDILNGMPPSR